MISAAICWASAALPPLPTRRILFPERSALMIAAAIARALASNAGLLFARSRAASESFKWAPIGSWLKTHRQGCSSIFGNDHVAAAQAREINAQRLPRLQSA